VPRPGDRRPLLADHAIELLGRGGARALTHQAVDRSAGLAAGSTSYYFRTREALVAAAIERIRNHSAAAFERAVPPDDDRVTVERASAVIAEQMRLLTTDRRSHAIAVFAVLPEVENDQDLRRALSNCLFSRTHATSLLRTLGARNSEEAGRDLVTFLIGLLFELLFGSLRDLPDDARVRASADTITRFVLTRL
jgi:DNA-binding transcriptional regulator YbjK